MNLHKIIEGRLNCEMLCMNESIKWNKKIRVSFFDRFVRSFNPYFIYLFKFIYFFIVPSLEERGIQNFFYFYLGDKNR